MANLLSLDNKVFASYVFYAAVLILKIFAVVFLIVYYRLTRKVFPSEEDYRVDPKKEKDGGIKTHPDVERARRMHQNDLENIPLFL
ncbi:Microsomal glutathione S-transferase 1, partial [Exaiptasia diaphana]